MNILHDEHGVVPPNSMTSSLLRVGRVSLVVSFLVPLPSLKISLAQFCLSNLWQQASAGKAVATSSTRICTSAITSRQCNGPFLVVDMFQESEGQTAFTHTAAMFEHQGLLSSDSKKVKSVSINATMCWVGPMGTCTTSHGNTVILKIVRLVHL